MSEYRNYNLQGLQLKVSPFLQKGGELIRSINVETDSIGAKKKRPGYGTVIGPVTGSVANIFDWTRDNGTQVTLYAAAGSQLYYSTQGTGAWTVCGNGTIPNGDTVVHAVLENTLMVASPNGTLRYSTDGTSFTDTPSAPIGVTGLAEYQNRIYAGGTASSLFYSTTGSPTDWTSDSSSLKIPGAGKLNSIFKQADRLIATKNSGLMFKWDGYSLTDLATHLGPTSPNSIDEVEDNRFYLNRLGIYSYAGNMPELISNPIEKYIYNDRGSGIVGSVFDTATGALHQYDYRLVVGTITDDLTNETINRAVLKYDYQQDEWSTEEYAVLPTALHSYKDATGIQRLIGGDSSGNIYQYGGTYTTDNGVAISAIMEGVTTLHAPVTAITTVSAISQPETDKKFNAMWAFASPGCQAQIQIAVANTFTKQNLTWYTLGDFVDGMAFFRFPTGVQGRLLFWKVIEASRNTRFNFYGFTVSYDNLGVNY